MNTLNEIAEIQGVQPASLKKKLNRAKIPISFGPDDPLPGEALQLLTTTNRKLATLPSDPIPLPPQQKKKIVRPRPLKAAKRPSLQKRSRNNNHPTNITLLQRNKNNRTIL